MNNNIDQKQVFKNRYIIPVFSAALFIILTISISYSMFDFKSISTDNTSWSNTSFPTKCNLNIITNGTTSFSVASRLFQNVNQTENVIAGQATSNVNIVLNGSECQCNYTLTFGKTSGGDTYTPTAPREFLYRVYQRAYSGNSGTRVPDTDYLDLGDTCSSGSIETGDCYIGSGFIKTNNSGNAVYHAYGLTTIFYNLKNYNQISQAGKNYSYALNLNIDDCSFMPSQTIYTDSIDERVRIGEEITPHDGEERWCGIINNGSSNTCAFNYSFSTQSECESEFGSGGCIESSRRGLTHWETDSSDVFGNIFLKYELMDTKVKAAYVCRRYTYAGSTNIACIRGGSPSYYGSYTGMSSTILYDVGSYSPSGNIQIIQSIRPYAIAGGNSNACTFSSSYSQCLLPSGVISASATGSVSSIDTSGNDIECSVGSDLESSCHLISA